MIYISELVAGKRNLRETSAPIFAMQTDVIVCGLGTAGSLAALFCAENGLSVLGVESLTCVGGSHTAGGVLGHYFGTVGGRYEDMDEAVKAFARRYTATAAESRKFLAEQALCQKNVEILYEASVCGVYLDENCVIGVRVLTEKGVLDCGAKIVMDCTGDGLVAVMAGCQTQQGRESDGQMQPYSLVSLVYDGQKYKFTNVDFGRVDQYDRRGLSEAIRFSRSYKIPEGHSAQMIAQVPMLGLREGRRIVAEEMVCLPDLFADKQTDTPMYYAYADLDKHGWDIAFDGETMGDWAIGANLGAYNITVAVPYQAILPKGFDGILVPCRALGVDRDISSCVRMNPDMKKLAEAAAAWATLAIRQGQKLREVPYEQLREKLMQSGCLKETDNRGYRIDGKKNGDGTPFVSEDVHWITDPEKLADRLKTDKPGQAIWSAKRMGDRAVPALRKLLCSPDENAAKHASFALAILGNSDGVQHLRDMVIKRDGMLLKDCRKNNNLRGCMAIYWLGRLGDREIARELMGLITDPNETDKPVYHRKELLTTRYEIADFSGVYFQYLSQAVMALVRLGDRYQDLRTEIARAFQAAFSTDDYYYRITQRPKRSSEGNMALSVKNIAVSALERWHLA